MNIKLGKADIAALACDGCRKKFVCNLANKKDETGVDFSVRAYIEKKLGLTLPLQDPPAIFKNAGSEGEKQVLLHLIRNQDCSIFSMSKDAAFGKKFQDELLPEPYVCFSSLSISELSNTKSSDIGQCRYKTDTDLAVHNLTVLAERMNKKPDASTYIYQMSFTPDISLLPERLFSDQDVISAYKENSIEVSEQRPDLLRVLPRQAAYPVLGSDMNQTERDGSKYIVEVCDIKTSEFSSSFFFELAFYMMLLKLWIDSNGLQEVFEVSYKAEIIPFDVASNSVRPDTWKMDFSLVRDKLFSVFGKTLPECVQAIESGDKSVIETVKCSARCQVCDYYGGQFEGTLYDKLHKQSPDNESYKNYIQNPKNHYCRYHLKSVQDINILPGVQSSDVTYLQSKGVQNLSELKSCLRSHAFKDNAELMSHAEGLLCEIAAHENKRTDKKVEATKSIGPYPPHLKIFTLIRQDSQRRTLCYGISYVISVYHVKTETLASDMNVKDGHLNDYNNKVFLMEIDSPDQASKLKALIAYIRAMHQLLIKYKDVRWKDTFGSLRPITYGIFYWGRKTFDVLKVNLQELLEYLVEHNDSLSDLYPELPETETATIAGEVKEAIQAYADLFTDDRVTYYEKILKSPLYDLQSIYKEVAAVNTDFSYNLIDVYSVVCGDEAKNYYYRPDSDHYSTYVYDGWFATDRNAEPKKKEKQQSNFEKRDRQHLYYLSVLLNKLYKKEKTNPFADLLKKGEFPVVSISNNNEKITDPRLLLIYLYQKLNAAYDQLEKEDAHVAPDMQKQYGGTSIHIERELTASEIKKKELKLLPLQRAYRISATAENANMDENTFGLTVYPANKFKETFKKISTNENANGCLYVDVILGKFDNYKPYTQLISCDISYIDNTNRILVIKYKDATTYKDRYGRERVATDSVLDIMGALKRIHGFDFSKDLYLERVHIDIWSDRLKKTIVKLESEYRNALDILLHPTLRHENNITPEDVCKSLQVLAGNDAGVKLDASQLKAISVMYNDNISLLWGPPGTGKSHTLAHYLLLELQKREQCKVLVMGNYNATNNLLNSLLKNVKEYKNSADICKNLDIIRFYSSTKVMEPLTPVNNEFFSTDEQVYDFIVKTPGISLDQNRKFVIITSTPEQLARITENKIKEALSEIDKFDIVIVDEASQMDLGHFLPALLRIAAGENKHSKFIIAGDDKQLQPVHKEVITGSEAALFGSVYNYFKNYRDLSGKQVFIPAPLNISRRSNHCIIDFIRDAFDYNAEFQSFQDIDFACVSYQKEPEESSTLYREILKPEIGLALLVYDDGLSSQRNEFEIQQICSYAKKIWECQLTDVSGDFKKFFTSGLGIVVPHTAQRAAIQKRLFNEFKSILSGEDYSEKEIRETINAAVDTVERFQGQERDIILAGYVVGNEDAIAKEEKFIYDKCRLNVIISRAKYKAIVMTSRELMNSISNDIEIVELQKAFQKLKDYCNSKIFDIDEPGWEVRRGKAYVKYV